MPLIARAARLFLIDAVHQLATEHGIRQFLDIGTGLPTADNTHHVAQRAAPESTDRLRGPRPGGAQPRPGPADQQPRGQDRLHPGGPAGYRTRSSRAPRATLDFSQPVAVLLIAVLHFIPDADDPYAIVARLMDAVAVRQLPGAWPMRPATSRPKPPRRWPALQRNVPGADHATEPRAGSPVLRRPGHGASRPGADQPVGIGRPDRRHRRRPRWLLRHGPRAIRDCPPRARAWSATRARSRLVTLTARPRIPPPSSCPPRTTAPGLPGFSPACRRYSMMAAHEWEEDQRWTLARAATRPECLT